MMKKSLLVKMIIFCSLNILLICNLAVVLGYQYKTNNENNLNHLLIIELQLDVDLLRLYLQNYAYYQDASSLNELIELQERLSVSWNQRNKFVSNNLHDILNQLEDLLQNEVKFNKEKRLKVEKIKLVERDSIIKSRMNILVQEMQQFLNQTHKKSIQNEKSQLVSIMKYYTPALIILSITSVIVAFLLLKSFIKGSKSLNLGFKHLRDGTLDYSINKDGLDKEFQEICNEFNEMTRLLHQNVVSKQSMRLEIESQTKLLKQQKRRLQLLAEKDPLTGVLNRRVLERELVKSMDKSDRTGLNLAVVFIDLDRFKEINDTYGHDAGDIILQEVSKRLIESTRKTDIISRFGGDEFVVVLDLLTCEEKTTKIVYKILSEICKPIEYDGNQLSVGASIGVAFYPKDGRDVLKLADKAMYEAKLSEQSKVVLYKDDELGYNQAI